jgi:uncharacterized membrane protein YeaQ/YmgE (transglycosylase-associated protein family)
VRIIFGILFGVIFALVGARFAGWLTDLIQMEQRFDSPDQVAQFRLVAEVGVTLAIALVGVAIGLIVAARLRPRLFRREV